MSVSISDVIEALVSLKLPPEVLKAVETELEGVEAAKADEKAETPKVRSQHVVVLLDPEGRAPGAANLSALVVTVPEGQDAGETLTRLYRSVYDQRAAVRRKPKAPIVTMGDAAESLKPGFTRPNGVTGIKTKTPVRVLVSNGQIPNA